MLLYVLKEAHRCGDYPGGLSVITRVLTKRESGRSEAEERDGTVEAEVGMTALKTEEGGYEPRNSGSS